MTIAADWLAQSARDLEAAELLAANGLWDWAAYAAAQAAEKSAKAMLISWGADLAERDRAKPWKTHEIGHLLHAFRRLPKSALLAEAVATLPGHDQQSRYPDVGGPGAPCVRYTEPMARDAIEKSRALCAYCSAMVPAIDGAWGELILAAGAAPGGR